MSGDILTVKTVKRVRSVRGSALVHISISTETIAKKVVRNLEINAFIDIYMYCVYLSVLSWIYKLYQRSTFMSDLLLSSSS